MARWLSWSKQTMTKNRWANLPSSLTKWGPRSCRMESFWRSWAEFKIKVLLIVFHSLKVKRPHSSRRFGRPTVITWTSWTWRYTTWPINPSIFNLRRWTPLGWWAGQRCLISPRLGVCSSVRSSVIATCCQRRRVQAYLQKDWRLGKHRNVTPSKSSVRNSILGPHPRIRNRSNMKQRLAFKSLPRQLWVTKTV